MHIKLHPLHIHNFYETLIKIITNKKKTLPVPCNNQTEIVFFCN